MGHQYAGNPAAFPADYTIPDDGNDRDAISVDVALEALGDRSVFLRTRMGLTRAQRFASSGSWTAPAGCTFAIIAFYGGGGGGGGGGDYVASGSASRYFCGGGGGGGALRRVVEVPITPGNVHDVTVGAPGPGGLTGDQAGTDGGDSIVAIRSGAELARAAGGQGGSTGDTFTGGQRLAFGGSSARASALTVGGGRTPTVDFTDVTFAILHLNSKSPSDGGAGITSGITQAQYGSPSPEGFAGGACGISGSDVGSGPVYHGGGAGGGGGAGPKGAGGAGGNGGNGISSGGGTFGTIGSNAPVASSGAGGGGGGGGGNGSAGSANAGAGGDGSGGEVVIIWTEIGTQ